VKSLPFLLATFSMLATLPAQELSPAVPVPPTTSADGTAPPALPDIERIANEAQRKIFEAADRSAGGSGTSGATPVDNQPMSFPTGGPQVTTTGSGKKATFSAPKGADPSTWEKGSSHKVAVMEIKFGGRRETVMFEVYPQDAPQTVSNFLDNVETEAYKGVAFHRAV
jgi:hypothetical protein